VWPAAANAEKGETRLKHRQIKNTMNSKSKSKPTNQVTPTDEPQTSARSHSANILGRNRGSIHILTLLTAIIVLLLPLHTRAGDYVIVVDVSGSMTERVSPKDKRIRVVVVQEALRQYLPALPQKV
jgi:hypothetical protein